jgi:type IV pilus assembly protein PilB
LRESRLLKLIRDKKLLSEKKVKQAVEHKKKLGPDGTLAGAIVELGFVNERQMSEIVARSDSVPVLNLAKHTVDFDAMEKLPRELLQKHKMLPLTGEKGKILLAMAQPLDFETVEEVQFMTNRLIETALAPSSQITSAIEDFYSQSPHERKARIRESAQAAVKKPKPVPKSPHLAEVLTEILMERGLVTREEIIARLKTREL